LGCQAAMLDHWCDAVAVCGSAPQQRPHAWEPAAARVRALARGCWLAHARTCACAADACLGWARTHAVVDDNASSCGRQRQHARGVPACVRRVLGGRPRAAASQRAHAAVRSHFRPPRCRKPPPVLSDPVTRRAPILRVIQVQGAPGIAQTGPPGGFSAAPQALAPPRRTYTPRMQHYHHQQRGTIAQLGERQTEVVRSCGQPGLGARLPSEGPWFATRACARVPPRRAGRGWALHRDPAHAPVCVCVLAQRASVQPRHSSSSSTLHTAVTPARTRRLPVTPPRVVGS
jgi:hypothetical protein